MSAAVPGSLFELPPATPRRAAPTGWRMRPYQREAIDKAMAEFEAGRHSALIVMPTGTGKTIVFAGLINEALRRWPQQRVLVLAHRRELIDQAAEKIASVTDEPVCIEMAERRAIRFGPVSRIIVSSIQTQQTRMVGFDPAEFGLVIVDEAHHATASSYRKVLAHYSAGSRTHILGVTATPDRADEEALGQVFESVAFEYDLLQAVSDGYLCKPMQRAVVCGDLDFSLVPNYARDFSEAELEALMTTEGTLHQTARAFTEYAAGRKTIVFASSVKHAELLTEILNDTNAASAACIHSKMPDSERNGIVRAYRRQEFQYLVNVGIATEGFDDPGTHCIGMARPTKSRALYAQMVGRATRTLPGTIDGIDTAEGRRDAIAASPKPHCEVIDLVGNSGKHKLVGLVDILGGKTSDDVLAVAREKVEAGEMDAQKAIEDAEREIAERHRVEREKRKKLRQAVQVKTSFMSELIDPFDVLDIRPERERGWHKGRPLSEKMAGFLKGYEQSLGVRVNELSYTHANQLIGEIKRRDLATDKQARILKRFGHTGTYSKREASALIDAIAANGWNR